MLELNAGPIHFMNTDGSDRNMHSARAIPRLLKWHDLKIDDIDLCRFASRMNLCFISAAPFCGYPNATVRSEIIRSSSLMESRPMSDLVVIVYPTEAKAEEMRTELISLQKEYLIELSDAVIAVKQDSGKVKLNQLMNTTAVGAVSGGFWGLLIGSLFLMPLLGASLGAASGALGGALTDFGINDAFMKELSASLQPGSAVLFVLIHKMTTDKVLDAIKGTGGTVLKTSLDFAKEQALRDALAASAGFGASPPSAGAAPSS